MLLDADIRCTGIDDGQESIVWENEHFADDEEVPTLTLGYTSTEQA